ncbi:conserved exported hypothetical protein [Magnetospirillum sp. LM-5]|uniref:FecR family protein n=1 Tax=Magnetospirillum sp. LM-5 TaxID=2681466 RepID=UPI001384DF57|nr:FecR family protein [Magnetospirillum sp. LM-5]CAA7615140.1 conserved exported hypothetical protein [Magnetospirillum sp. LM-5]
MPRFLALILVILLFLTDFAQAAPVGTVTRLQGVAEAGALALAEGATIPAGAILRTGPGARLEVRFVDGTMLTLGEKAEVIVDQFLFDGAAGTGTARFAVNQGAFLVATGAVAKLPERPFKVVTPIASIGVRGTKFWGGPLDNPLDVLVLDGMIRVESAAGAVDLTQPGQGTAVKAAGTAPQAPSFWSEQQVGRAFGSVSFR